MIGRERMRFDSRRTFRHEATEAEERLWEAIRDRQVDGLKFRRQHPVKPFVLDFYCPKAHLAIEVDGDIHDFQPEEDAARTAFLEETGYRVIRFRNEEVLYRLDEVLQRIATAAAEGSRKPRRGSSPSLSISFGDEMEREGARGRVR